MRNDPDVLRLGPSVRTAPELAFDQAVMARGTGRIGPAAHEALIRAGRGHATA